MTAHASGILGLARSQANSLAYIVHHPMNRGQVGAALWRWAAWQVRGLLGRGERLVPFVDGARLALRRGMTGATQNVYCGLADYREMAFLLHLLRPHDLFVDVGANVGTYTVLAAAVAGADALSFEPQADAIAMLRKNVSINQVEGRVRAVRAAVAAAPGEVWLGRPDGPQTKVVSAADGHTMVEATTLDAALDGRAPRLIKIDVEGFEIEVLKGAGRTLADPDLLGLIVEVNGSDAVVATLAGHGFRPMRYEPRSRDLIALPAVDPASVNTIFVRDVARVAPILRGARTFTTTAGRI
jgi:FkbM family methyltransferase